MKKMGLFLIAMVLATTALVFHPVPAYAICIGPTCLIGPRCCSAEACVSFCESRNPGSIPHCSGSGSHGGCCSCQSPQA